MAEGEFNRRDFEKFANEISRSLEKYRKNSYLNKETKRHQKNLENLLVSTNALLKDDAGDKDKAKFDELLTTTELSYDLMKRRAKEDTEFRKEFKKSFGGFQQAATFSKRVFGEISVAVKDLRKSANLLNKETRQDVGETALNMITGPFGKMILDSVDFSGIKDVVKKRAGKAKGVAGRVDGQAHDGIREVPHEGTYILDGGERVLSAKQNEDLTGFLDIIKNSVSANSPSAERGNAVNDDPIPVYNTGHSRGWFDAFIEAEDRMQAERESAEKRRHKETITRFQILNEVISTVGDHTLDTWITGMTVWYNRFMRHPIWNTLVLTMRGLGKIIGPPLKLMLKPLTSTFSRMTNFLFGTKRESETDRIVKSNEDITNAVRKIDTESDKGWVQTQFQKLLTTRLFGPDRGNNNVDIAQRAEDKRSRGEELTKQEDKLLVRYQDYITQRNKPFAEAANDNVMQENVAQKAAFDRGGEQADGVPSGVGVYATAAQQQKAAFSTDGTKDPAANAEHFEQMNETLDRMATIQEDQLEEMEAANDSSGGIGGSASFLRGGVAGWLASKTSGLLRKGLIPGITAALTLGWGWIKKPFRSSLFKPIRAAFSGGWSWITGAFRSVVKSPLAKALARPFVSLGGFLRSGIMGAITKVGPAIFSAFGAKLLGAIGVAWTAGNLIGTYVVNPIISAIDSIFGTGIRNWIGGFVFNIIAWLEKWIPGVSWITGGSAAELKKQMEEEGLGGTKEKKEKSQDSEQSQTPSARSGAARPVFGDGLPSKTMPPVSKENTDDTSTDTPRAKVREENRPGPYARPRTQVQENVKVDTRKETTPAHVYQAPEKRVNYNIRNDANSREIAEGVNKGMGDVVKAIKSYMGQGQTPAPVTPRPTTDARTNKMVNDG